MKNLLASTLFVAIIVASIFPASSEGFSSVVDDKRLKISVFYPVELRIGECSSIRLQVTFLGNVSVDRLRFTVTYVSEAGSTILLSDTIVSAPRSFVSGDVISKTYSLCIPSTVRRDPIVTATVYANYTREATYQPFTHDWHVAVVRNRTYQDLLNDLARAENTINSLQQTIQNLQGEINRIRTRLEETLRELGRLSSSLEGSRREYERLEQRFLNLTAEYNALNQRFTATAGELRSLETLYESLRKENAALHENYRILLRDYTNLTKEFNMLQASYTQLQTLYNNLSGRHESAKQQIGYLQSQLDQNMRELADLRLRHNLLSEENTWHRNLMYVEAFTLLGLVTGLVSFAFSRKRQQQRVPALPPPPPQ